MALLHEPVLGADQRVLVGLSGRQAHLYGPTGEETSSTPQKQFLHDVRRGKLASFTWITPLCADSDHPSAAADTDHRGSRRSSTRSARASFGTRPRSSCSGTIGAASTITFRRPTRTTTAWAFRVPLIVISPYAKKTTSRTCSTRRRACCASPRISSASASSRRPTRARPRRPRTASTSQQKPRAVRADRGAEARRAFFLQHSRRRLRESPTMQ